MYKTKSRFHKKSSGKKKWLVVVTLLLILGTALTALEKTGTINLLKNKKTPSEQSNAKDQPSSPGPSSSPDADKGQSQDEDKNNDADKSNNEAGDATLFAPSGNFVSNHEPNLDGSPSPNTMESVCVTSPGASCSISFTKNGIVKTLPTRTADAEGSVFWNWTLQDYDLTEGTWNIEAKATLGGQTKTTKDTVQLNVQP